jgi:hypothetical protein
MNGFTLNRTLAAVVIAGIAVHQHLAFYRTPGIDQYHANVRAAAALVPNMIGPWVGQDVPTRAQALTVLRPNVMISRHYINIETGASVSVMLVHCVDAHSMVGHYPGRCYPADGWTLKNSTPRDWVVGNLTLTGTEYEFTTGGDLSGGLNAQDIIVANCLLRPGGLILRDMDSMSNSILGAAGQSLGAGQLQIIFDASVPQDQRDATLAVLAQGYKPVLDAILATPSSKQ